ncbi:hypothetical protein [uncultured Pontibacter sp.]|uniref:hypothetical protein n=1 Tax=uncultured Pontibacter sp. TaxID=453356 RepID=UPI00261C89DA|nr:hypothetical protein [uncultured Pontibacter sp.]
MTNSKKLLLALFAVLLHLQAFAQKQSFSKLELKPGEEFTVAPGNILIVDTLVLHDNSAIRFNSSKEAKLGARVAYVGEGCLITSKGADGVHGSLNLSGAAGEDGANLEIDVHFMELGSLTIDTRGGAGGDGYVGKHGAKAYSKTSSYTKANGKGGFEQVSYTVPVSSGTNGEKGTPGGTAGSGGNLKLIYSTSNFIVNFNQSSRSNQKRKAHTIDIYYKAGKDGKAGRDGDSYIESTVIRGLPVSINHEPKLDGQLKITNAGKL